ncbi:MAG TPA: hypothetical protein PLD20_09560 [Blastocatellia bacterium]|nr:hypothetical protein [Blastocatellia bacterium]HMV86143.1 hypothetical protein [Blastocatellia bacterium]HMX25341.1 hypothetical protein [Blastocatellia bacterium]HMY71025.1 hypothetical protein [Blastocatellia bacterium]HMZ18165.1 hypothetical protein [Blastocatellia bacterium]
MRNLKQFGRSVALVALMMVTALAQNPVPLTSVQNPVPPDVNILIQPRQVQFVAQKAIQEMRFQVFDEHGELVYDTGVLTEPELKWNLHNGNGGELTSGLYAYKLTIKEQGKETAEEKRGHFIIERAAERQSDRLWMTSQGASGVGADVQGSEITVATSDQGTVAGTRQANTTAEKTGGKTQDGKAETTKAKALTNSFKDTSSGSPNFIAKWVAADQIGNSVLYESNGNIGIGTNSPAAKLDILALGSTTTAATGIRAIVIGNLNSSSIAIKGESLSAGGGILGSGDSGIGVEGKSNSGTAVRATSTSGAALIASSTTGPSILAPSGNVGIGTTTPAFPLSFPNTLGDKISLWGTSGNHYGFGIQGSLLQIHTGANTDDIAFGFGRSAAFTETMRVKGNGNVGIGTTNPLARLYVSTTTKNAGDNTATFAAPAIGSNLSHIHYGTTGDWYIRSAASGGKVVLQDTGGNVGIGTSNPTSKLNVVNSDTAIKGESTAINSYGVYGQNTSTSGCDINCTPAGVYGEAAYIRGAGVFGQSTGLFASGVYGKATGNLGKGVEGSGHIGVFGSSLDSHGYAGYFKNYGGGTALQVDGLTSTYVLQITGGSDLSEQFEVNEIANPNEAHSPIAIQPGLIVSIDPDKPGELVLSGYAYDHRVAGIISGAGGVKTGMLMGQPGSIADGKYPVALTGRVYCWADASNGPINPGDLLTTSAIPGHAMKVTDHAKAQGSIIGKAMTSLKEGRGLVLVLVSLQ